MALVGKVLEARGYQRLGRGSQRCGYLSPNGKWVVKVPIDGESSEYANEFEAHCWKTRDYTKTPVRLARCRMCGPLLVMEAVEVVDPTPCEWAHWIDNHQVGLNRAGDFVAFDYAQNEEDFLYLDAQPRGSV